MTIELSIALLHGDRFCQREIESDNSLLFFFLKAAKSSMHLNSDIPSTMNPCQGELGAMVEVPTWMVCDFGQLENKRSSERLIVKITLRLVSKREFLVNFWEFFRPNFLRFVPRREVGLRKPDRGAAGDQMISQPWYTEKQHYDHDHDHDDQPAMVHRKTTL